MRALSEGIALLAKLGKINERMRARPALLEGPENFHVQARIN